MTSQPEPPTQHRGGFFSWLRGLGIIRSDERWLAGVAGGLAARAGIDPLIVRGVFIVLTILGGPGLLLYLVGWLLLPNTAGRIHVEDIVRGRASSQVITISVIAAAFLVLPVLFMGIGPLGAGTSLFFGFGAWDLWGALGFPTWLTTTIAWIFWLAVVVGGAFLLHRWLLKRGQEHRDSMSPETPEPTGASSSERGTSPSPQPDGAQNFTDQANRLGEQAQSFSEKASKWSEDAGHRVDEWSSRYAKEHEAHALGAGHVLLTLAAALLAAGFAAFVALQAGFEFTAPGTTAAAFAAPLVAGLVAAVAVLALSLIVAGVRGRRTGVVGFLSFCGVIALLITAVLPWGSRFQPFGEMHVNGSSSPGAVSLAGNIELDLGDLDRRDQKPVDLVVWQAAGDVNVVLPESMPTVLSVRVLAGRIDAATSPSAGSSLETRTVSGPFISRTIAVNLPPRATVTSPGDASHVTVYILAGTAEITDPEPSARTQFLSKESTR